MRYLRSIGYRYIMPQFEFQCQGCGFIIEELFKPNDNELAWVAEQFCPMKCEEPLWRKIISKPQRSERVRSDSRFPHVTHMSEPCVHYTKDGPVMGTRRLVAKSRTHMEQLMNKHGYVHYEAPVDGGSQGHAGKMPAHIKKLETENPMVRKYLDMKASGRIASAMVLTDKELKERFNVDG